MIYCWYGRGVRVSTRIANTRDKVTRMSRCPCTVRMYCTDVGVHYYEYIRYLYRTSTGIYSYRYQSFMIYQYLLDYSTRTAEMMIICKYTVRPQLYLGLILHTVLVEQGTIRLQTRLPVQPAGKVLPYSRHILQVLNKYPYRTSTGTV